MITTFQAAAILCRIFTAADDILRLCDERCRVSIYAFARRYLRLSASAPRSRLLYAQCCCRVFCAPRRRRRAFTMRRRRRRRSHAARCLLMSFCAPFADAGADAPPYFIVDAAD